MTHTRLAPVLALALALLAAATGGVVAARPAAVVAPGAAAGAVGDDTCACEDYQCDCKKKIEFNKHLETTLDASFALVPSTNTSDAGFANVTLSADGKEKVTVPFISAAKAEDPGLACFTVAKVCKVCLAVSKFQEVEQGMCGCWDATGDCKIVKGSFQLGCFSVGHHACKAQE